MNQHLTRRTLLAGTLAASTLKIGDTVANDEASLPSIPIGWPDLPPGLGFRIGHGFQSENSWYLPGYWHCGEDWYANDRDSGGALVYAMQDGEVVFVGSEYPGRVVIIQHGLDLYSMYGHLDPAVEVSEGQSVNAGQPLGKVLLRNDGIAPSHLHLETRTFLFTSEVNGDQPRYGFACGQNCAPGPGYWPMNAPDLPVEQGWRNPMHIFGAWIANHLAHVDLLIVMATDDMSDLSWWTGSPLDTDRTVVQTGDLEKGSLLEVSAIYSGAPEVKGTSAATYSLWIRATAESGRAGWVPLLASSAEETGADGRPSSVSLLFVPAAGWNSSVK